LSLNSKRQAIICFFLGHRDSLLPIEGKKWYYNEGCLRCKKRTSKIEWIEKTRGEYTRQ